MAVSVCIVAKTTYITDVDTVAMSVCNMAKTARVLMAGNYDGCACVYCGQEHACHRCRYGGHVGV